MPYRMIQCNWKPFSTDMVPVKFQGKCKHLLEFSGLILKFSAICDLGFKKGALVSHLALQQFITDHSIPAAIIFNGDPAKNFSAKWIQLCSKYKIVQFCSETYKQNQNCVEHWIQEAKMTVSQMKLHTCCDDECAYNMW